MPEGSDERKEAGERSGTARKITFYLPGMFHYHGLKGKYPGVSVTGSRCTLQCDHCRAGLLKGMIAAEDPRSLLEVCIRLKARGHHGVLLSGGSDRQGRIPWKPFLPAIEKIKSETGLYISVHSGLVDDETARGLKAAGVDQALIDVVGDDETYRRVCHVPFGVDRIRASMEAMRRADLALAPHIVCGLDGGKMGSEERAVRMIATVGAEQVVVVSLMPSPGTPFHRVSTPSAEEVARIISCARELMPDVRISLGCARKRGDTAMELSAIDAGVDRMALPSEEAVAHARRRGLRISYQRTCCSVSLDLSRDAW
ncbi:MAG: radical SAM protein [Deltaproteobacteria bacterium]|nr:radical SAM protein [Deltaproteobacteria bacterium]MBW2346478.1 radical SAM protein [Deltaproteobacteria bacterium]